MSEEKLSEQWKIWQSSNIEVLKNSVKKSNEQSCISLTMSQ